MDPMQEAMDPAQETALWARQELERHPEIAMAFAQCPVRHIARQAVLFDPMLLEFASLALKEDWGLVHVLVQRNGLCLQWASDELAVDSWLIMRAIEQSPEALFVLKFGGDEGLMNTLRAITLWPHIRGRIPAEVLGRVATVWPDKYRAALDGTAVAVYHRRPSWATPWDLYRVGPPPDLALLFSDEQAAAWPSLHDAGPILAEAGPILADAGEEVRDPLGTILERGVESSESSEEEGSGESSVAETASEEEQAGSSSESETPSTMPPWYASDVESDVSTPPPPPPPFPPGARVDHRTGHVIFDEP